MKYPILFLLLLSFYQMKAQEIRQLENAVKFLQKEICERGELKDFFKREKDKKTNLEDFRVDSIVTYLSGDDFSSELELLGVSEIIQFEDYFIGSLAQLSPGNNGLVLSFSKPENNYVLAELSAYVFVSESNIKFGKSSKLLFVFDDTDQVKYLLYRQFVHN